MSFSPEQIIGLGKENSRLTWIWDDSYNRYLAIAARVVRRSLKEDLRIQAERRGEMDLRFARWEVRAIQHHAGDDGVCH